MKIKLGLLCVLGLLLVLPMTVSSAQESPVTPTVDHAAHHAGQAEATPEATDSPADMGGMQMEGSDEADHMSMMQSMMSMMESMMGMDMSADMRDMMNQMHDMMSMMHGGEMAMEATATPEMGAMAMEMDSGYSVDDLAPLAFAYYNGGDVYFVHPEASDPGVAEVLTAMMGTDVITVPSLAEVPEELLGAVYVFTNGLDGMGPLGHQPDVFDSVPGVEGYTPLRSVHLVTWQDGVEARELTSVEAVLAAETAGEVVIEVPGVVVNMPILLWPDGQR